MGAGRPRPPRSGCSAPRKWQVRVLAIGCLIPLVLIVAGALAGGVFGSTHAAILGAVAGGVIGTIAMIALLMGFERIRGRGVDD